MSPLNQAIPRLRPDLEINSIEHEGQPMMLVSDYMGLDPNTLLLAPGAIMVATLFDDQKTAKDIVNVLAQQKAVLAEQDVENLATELKKHTLLETPEAQEKRKKLLQAFSESPVRAMPPRGRGLPREALELGAFLGKFYSDPEGPGEIKTPSPLSPTPRAVISPHIDLFRGGPQYAWAYGELSKCEAPDVIIALGVAHMSPRSPWVLTPKTYETPYGPVEIDQELYEGIRQKLWYNPLEEEWVHAKEHSLEFQALWLKYLWRDNTPKWVPILCSNFESYCADKGPSSVPSLEKAIEDIGGLLAQQQKAGKKIMILAGIDLAHVGKRFGDDRDITPELEKKIEELDRESLGKAFRLEAEPFFQSGVGEGAWRKVCGLSTLYTSLRLIRHLSHDASPEGRLLSYGQAPDPAGGVVSFVSAVFDR